MTMTLEKLRINESNWSNSLKHWRIKYILEEIYQTFQNIYLENKTLEVMPLESEYKLLIYL